MKKKILLTIIFFISIFCFFSLLNKVSASSDIYSNGIPDWVEKELSERYSDYYTSDYFWVGYHLDKDDHGYYFMCFKNLDTFAYTTSIDGYNFKFKNNNFLYYGSVKFLGDQNSFDVIEGYGNHKKFDKTFWDSDYITEKFRWCSGGISIFFNSETQCSNKINGIFYKNLDVFDSENCTNYFFQGAIFRYTYSLSVSTTEPTKNPITVYTNLFNIEDLPVYKVYISQDNETFNDMHVETWTDETGRVRGRYYYTIYQNGVYYFKFLNKETGSTKILTLSVLNIDGQQQVDSHGIPFPSLSFYKADNDFVIRTQSFTQEQISKYRSYYSLDPQGDNWNRMSIGTTTNTSLNQLEYFFFFTVPADSNDCTFYIRFYDETLKKYGSIASLDCRFSNMNDYVSKVEPAVDEGENTIEDLKKYFSERFGFLTYPFEFIDDLINRIMNINYSEPVLHIPELKAPYRRL